MHSSASLPQTIRGLRRGAQEHESQFRTTVCHASKSMPIAVPEQGGEKRDAGRDLNPSVVSIVVFHGN
jgi:hypothetical protein